MNIRNPLLQQHYNFITICSMVSIICLFLLIISISDAFASHNDPIGDTLCNIVKIVRGKPARAVALAGVLVLAMQVLRGQLKWEVAFIVITGVVIMFKAPDIVNMISADASDPETAACGV